MHALVFPGHKARQLWSGEVQAGLAATKEGTQGGYHAVRSAADVTLPGSAARSGSNCESAWKSGNAGIMYARFRHGGRDGTGRAGLDEECKSRLEAITLVKLKQQQIKQKQRRSI